MGGLIDELGLCSPAGKSLQLISGWKSCFSPTYAPPKWRVGAKMASPLAVKLFMSLFLHFNQLKSQIKIETCFAHSWSMHCKNFQPKKTNFSPSYCPPNLRVDAKMASLRRAVKLAPIVFVLKWIHSVICSTLGNNNKKVCSANDVIIIKGVQFRIFMTKDEQVAAGARSRKKAN